MPLFNPTELFILADGTIPMTADWDFGGFALSNVASLDVDNININGNSITSTDAAGNINITPHTTGDLVLDGLKWPQADGTSGYVLQTNGAGQLSWVAQSGGGGSPGGSTTQVQYNNAGAFGGITDLTYDGTDLLLGGTAGTTKLQFRDTAIYVQSSADGILNIVSDVEVQLDSALFDLNATTITADFTTATFTGATTHNGAFTVSRSDTAVDAQFIINQGSTGDATMSWTITGDEYRAYIDNSDGDSFKFEYTTGTPVTWLDYDPATSILTLGVNGDVEMGYGSASVWYPNTTGAVDLGKSANRIGDVVMSGNLDILDANIILGTTTGTQVGTSTSQKLGFWGVTPVTRPSAYTPTNVTTDRTYDADSTSTAELADILGTLIADLQSIGLIG